jgi:hypothetical protein
MACPLRIQYEHALYHITGRGNERKKIFHYHLLGESPQANLSAIMSVTKAYRRFEETLKTDKNPQNTLARIKRQMSQFKG